MLGISRAGYGDLEINVDVLIVMKDGIKNNSEKNEFFLLLFRAKQIILKMMTKELMLASRAPTTGV